MDEAKAEEMQSGCDEMEKHNNDMKDGESTSALQHEHDEVVATEKVLNAMLFYRRYGITKIHLSISAYQKLSETQRAALSPAYQYHLMKVKDCVVHNQKILKQIIECGISMFGNDFALRSAAQMTQLRPSTDHYMTKVRSTLKQIMRDWSTEGEVERKSCYNGTIEILREHFPDRKMRAAIKILVPGAGLGRLVWELVAEGFSVQGNEFSILMLLTSNFLLNKCKQANEHIIYPFVLDTCNNWSYEDQIRPVRFPDVCPVMPDDKPNEFSMCAGDFLEAMKNDVERWDVVVTIFFIDTAVNVLDYIDTIHRIMRKGGLWINFGPLTYHFADGEADGAIELPYDLIIHYITEKGFRFERDERGNKSNVALYACNQKSMLRYQYNCGFFVCTKL